MRIVFANHLWFFCHTCEWARVMKGALNKIYGSSSYFFLFYSLYFTFAFLSLELPIFILIYSNIYSISILRSRLSSKCTTKIVCLTIFFSPFSLSNSRVTRTIFQEKEPNSSTNLKWYLFLRFDSHNESICGCVCVCLSLPGISGCFCQLVSSEH